MYVEFNLNQPLPDTCWIFGRCQGIIPAQPLEENLSTLADLRGEFSVAASIDETLYLFRDPVGVAPLYYSADGSSLIVSSSISKIIAGLGKSLSINHDYLKRIWQDDYTDLESTAFREIHRVPPGILIYLRAGEFHRARYIEPIPQRTPREITNFPTLERIFFTALERRIPPDRKLAVLVSGGLDSALLTHALSHLDPTCNLHSFSLDFKSQPEWSRDLNAVLDCGRWLKTVQFYEDLDPNIFAEEQADHNPFIFYGPTLYLFKPGLIEAQRRGLRVVCTGLGGDDLFSASPLAYGSLIRQLKIGTYWQAAQHRESLYQVLRYTFSALIPNGLMRWWKANSRLAAEPWRKLKLLPHLRNDFARFFLSGGYLFAMENEQELAQHFGLRMSYPLLDYDLIQTQLRMPVEPDFQNKPALRKLAKGLVPEEIRLKRSAQDYSAFEAFTWASQAKIFANRLSHLTIADWVDALPKKPSLDDELKLNYFYRVEQTAKGTQNGVQSRKGL